MRDVVPPTSDCVLNCAANKFKNIDGTCRDCHPTCGSCIKGDDKSCLTCLNPAADFKLRESSSTVYFQCVADCPLGKYKDIPNMECLTCTSNCLQCTTATNCLQCAPSYHQVDFFNPLVDPNPCTQDAICEVTTWLNSTYQCQLICGARQVWVHPNSCYDCPEACSSCEEITKRCFVDLRYFLSTPAETNTTNDLTLNFDFFKDNQPLEIPDFKTELLQKDYIKLTIDELGLNLNFAEYQDPLEFKLKLGIKFSEKVSEFTSY